MTNLEKEELEAKKKTREFLFWLTLSFSIGISVGILGASAYFTPKHETEVFDEKVSTHGCVVQPYSVLLKEGLGRTCKLPGGAVVVEYPSKL